MVDKFVAIGTVFIFFANAFAIAAVVSPWWIIYKPQENLPGEPPCHPDSNTKDLPFSFYEGVNRYGLTMSCRQAPDGEREWCGAVDVPSEWKATLGLLIVGILCLCCTFFLLIVSLYKRKVLDTAQNVAFVGSKPVYSIDKLKSIFNNQKNQSLITVFNDAVFPLIVVLFCLAALVFPVGFYFDEIGGTPYKLTPSTSKVGTSYVLFIMAIFFTIIGELFACRVCAPMF